MSISASPINIFYSFTGKTAFNCGTPGFEGSLQWYPLYSVDSNSNEIATVLHLHKHHQQQQQQQEQYHEQQRQQQQRQINSTQLGKMRVKSLQSRDIREVI